jgi:hypothetical protein
MTKDDIGEEGRGMVRAFDLLAGLPEEIDLDSLQREKDLPQERNGL